MELSINLTFFCLDKTGDKWWWSRVVIVDLDISNKQFCMEWAGVEENLK